jgi:hypothetical protein
MLKKLATGSMMQNFGSFAFLLEITLYRDGENKPEKFDTDNGGFIMIHTDKP